MADETPETKSESAPGGGAGDPARERADAGGDDRRADARGQDRVSALASRFAGAPAAVLLALVLFGLVNYLAARHYRRWDWTRARLFTLSPRSREVVRSLRAPVDLYVFLGPREAQYSDVTELAQRYGAESNLLRVHAIDPDRQRDRFLELSRTLGLRVGRTATADVASESAIVVVRGERHHEVPRERLAGLGDEGAGDEGSATRTDQAQVTVERAITEAILRVDRDAPTRVCFATGHGELALQGGDDSLSMLATELLHDNVTTRAVEVRGSSTVPADCDALVIAGPRQAYTAGDAEIVARYLRAGGNVLMLLDPSFVERRYAPTGLEPVARLGGIELTQSVVIENDPAHQLPEMLGTTFTASAFGEHPVTRAMRGIDARVLVATARALRRAEGASVVPQSLIQTTAQAWGETGTADAARGGELRRDPGDVAGPVDIAMASQVPDVRPRAGREAAGRLVVVGYSHLATNEAVALGFQARFQNSYFVTAAIGWLTARRELVDVPPRPASAAAINVSLTDMRHVRLYTMLLVPLAAALVGVAVWRARRAP